MSMNTLPVAIIGAGPIGLAAAAQLLSRGLEPLVLEAGPEVGHAVRAWGHVRMFSPWRYNIDSAARTLLDAEGWVAPDADGYPTGAELVADYLAPLAASAALRGRIARVPELSVSPAATMAASMTARDATPHPSYCTSPQPMAARRSKPGP
ncbi:FAD-dependent oxidoreductase [Siccirubricoccus deserti]